MLNKIDKIKNKTKLQILRPIVYVSSLTKEGINKLKQSIIDNVNYENSILELVSDLIKEDDLIVLIVPIDKVAPKGKLILPQQQVIRDILDITLEPFLFSHV